MRARLRENRLVATALSAVLVAVYLFPVYWMVATSLKAQREIFAIPPKLVPWPPDLAPYREAVLGNPDVARGVLNRPAGHPRSASAPDGPGRRPGR